VRASFQYQTPSAPTPQSVPIITSSFFIAGFLRGPGLAP
jgi:hypothetical protein